MSIAEYVCRAKPGDIPAADRAAIERSCFDVVGILLAGRTSRHAQMVQELVREDGGPGECTVLAAGLSAPAPGAALVNGTSAHADDFDDMGGYAHPSAALVPGLLAAAELRGSASGAEMITAYPIGFDVGATLCQGGHYDQYARGFHSTSIFGMLASTTSVRVSGIAPTSGPVRFDLPSSAREARSSLRFLVAEALLYCTVPVGRVALDSSAMQNTLNAMTRVVVDILPRWDAHTLAIGRTHTADGHSESRARR